MRKLMSIFLIFLLPIVTLGADGIDGCLISTGPTGQLRLYWNPYSLGAGSPTEWIGSPPGNGNYNIVTPSQCFKAVGAPCKVYSFNTIGSSPPSSQMIYTGNYAIVVPCPIDDYVPFVLIGAAGVGAVILRRREDSIQL